MNNPQQSMELARRVGELLDATYSASSAYVAAYAFAGDKGQVFSPDYTVFVSGQVNPVIAVEVKVNCNNDILSRLVSTARRVKPIARGETRLYLATPASDRYYTNCKIEFYDLTEIIISGEANPDFHKMKPLTKLPSPETLNREAEANTDRQIHDKRDKFKWVLAGCILAGLIVLVLDGLKLYELSWERLALLAAIALLSLLPYFDVISLGEISLKRHRKQIADSEPEKAQ